MVGHIDVLLGLERLVEGEDPFHERSQRTRGDHALLLDFATVTAGWFCVTLAALARPSGRGRNCVDVGRRHVRAPTERIYRDDVAMLPLMPNSRRT